VRLATSQSFPRTLESMNASASFRRTAFACLLALCASGAAQGQSTDGFHTIQVFPVVVDSDSFAQRFTFRNPNPTALTIAPTYYPANGTSQAAALACPAVVVPADSDVTLSSLRTLCPALAAGSQFGFLYTYQDGAANLPYSGFSRVSNPQGQGFTVEAFSAQEFTSADATVSGIRRLAATPSSPTFQTNCFVGVMNLLPPGTSTLPTEVYVRVIGSNGALLGSQQTVLLTPGRLTRLLDVFAAVGAPAGNHDNARVEFEEDGDGEPGILAFCTVQDNTSFGADFRIAKQEQNFGGDFGFGGIGAQDDLAARESWLLEDMRTNTGGSTYANRPFAVGTGVAAANTHVMYFRHPDWIQCELIDPDTAVRATNGYGLEMRMVANDGATVIAGGNNLQGWGKVYLGEKEDRNEGANSRYTIEVQSNGQNTGNARPYELHCQSGSGHTGGDILQYQQAVNRF
jgi:hypothetical protein